mgnify:CR=1 FL=1
MITPINCENEKLKIRGLKAEKYYVNYFYPWNLSTPFASSDDMGPKVKIECKVSGTPVFVTVRKKDTSFNTKSMIEEDTIFIEHNPSIRELNENQNEEQVNETDNNFLGEAGSKNHYLSFEVYPNPTMGELVILNTGNTKSSEISVVLFSGLGVKMDAFSFSGKEFHYNFSQLDKGTYFLQFSSEGAIIETKKIIKL